MKLHDTSSLGRRAPVLPRGFTPAELHERADCAGRECDRKRHLTDNARHAVQSRSDDSPRIDGLRAMRCHYLSDLHLEFECFRHKLVKGDVLIVVGDLCHARCLDPVRSDKYSAEQRGRGMRFIDEAHANLPHVLLIAGNHEHYDRVFEDTVSLLRRHLPGVTVLDDETVEIEGIRFFGSTLWSDFEAGSEACMNGVRRRMGEFFFVKTGGRDADGRESARAPAARWRRATCRAPDGDAREVADPRGIGFQVEGDDLRQGRMVGQGDVA